MSKQLLNFEQVIEENEAKRKKTFPLSAVKSCLIFSTNFRSECINNIQQLSLAQNHQE